MKSQPRTKSPSACCQYIERRVKFETIKSNMPLIYSFADQIDTPIDVRQLAGDRISVSYYGYTERAPHYLPRRR